MPDTRVAVKVQVTTSDGLSFLPASASNKAVLPPPASTAIEPLALISISAPSSISHRLVLVLLYMIVELEILLEVLVPTAGL